MSDPTLTRLRASLVDAADRHPLLRVYVAPDGDTFSESGTDAKALDELGMLLRRAAHGMLAAGIELPLSADERAEKRVLRWLVNQPTSRAVGAWCGVELPPGDEPEYYELPGNIFRALAEALSYLVPPEGDDEADEPDEIVTRDDILERYSFGERTLKNYAVQSWFPKPIDRKGKDGRYRYSWKAVKRAFEGRGVSPKAPWK